MLNKAIIIVITTTLLLLWLYLPLASHFSFAFYALNMDQNGKKFSWDYGLTGAEEWRSYFLERMQRGPRLSIGTS